MIWKLGQRGKQSWLCSPDIFSVEELDRVGTLWSDKKQPAAVGSEGEGKVARDIRACTIQWVSPCPDSEWLFDVIETAVLNVNQHFGLDLVEIESLQLTEYDEASGYYKAHIDRDYGRLKLLHRKLTMSMQLSTPDEYDGGELLLYPSSLTPVQIPRQRGMCTFFRSDVVHEARPVTRGVRRCLVAWIAGPELR